MLSEQFQKPIEKRKNKDKCRSILLIQICIAAASLGLAQAHKVAHLNLLYGSPLS